MRDGKSFTWIFPLFVTVSLLLLLPAGRWKLPPEVIRHSLEQVYPLNRSGSVASAFSPVFHLADHRADPGQRPKNSPSFSRETDGTAILFTHIGDGEIPGTDRSFKTTLFLINDTSHVSEGRIEFYDDQGDPLAITVDETTSSSFPISLQPSSLTRIVTAGSGAVKSGWAHVHASQPLIGAGTFGIIDGQDRILTEVGIPEGIPGKDFTLFADMIGISRTGLALSNPSSSEEAVIAIELNDREGNLLATQQWRLSPLGLRARFIDEFFAEVAGIQELEGSLHITSDTDFSGITLRSTGDQLTSMPLVPAPGEGAEWTKLAFPHIGDGSAGLLTIRSSVILINNTTETTVGQVEFFASDGNAMLLTAGGSEGSAFEVTIPAGGVYRLTTDAAGTLQAGWARVTMDQPIEGTALYTLEDAQGNLQTEVGVSSAALQQEFILIADSIGQANTGIALVNPVPESERRTISLDLDLYAHDQAGRTAGVS
ncbi:MAG: hypothetical protein JSU96_11425, partial [Acidobacteriota bacterium]